ncbi:DUF1285 domain-containing protein [Citreicella sp. C3M06]|uniref:DUF1285 domain-containing protein n=1 Tax=Citreicella sp. C3M06 TaxID=2841564 RepID=UPI001C082254|nr:DUF1285 domain-containing protein [Citreicella sp. C3M06]MBU2963760.1 DUF1285 domain-containing protein [Citreicella sp. C3M06]
MTSQNSVTTPLDTLAASASAKKGLPPVHKWHPPLSGTMDMVIRRDGSWWHEGTQIQREALVRLFSTILRKDGKEFVLLSPVEKWIITVEDAPFVAVDVDVIGDGDAQVLRFTTNVGDTTDAGPDAPIRVSEDPATGAPSPYVMVRDGLEALIDRKTFYRLAELGEEHDGRIGVRSNGVVFALEG